jgi:hypothetical protein
MRLATVLGAAVAALALSVAAAPAGAATIFLYSNLDGAQETPPVATTATGNANITYDDVANLLSWTITYSGLSAPSTDAHFHGPAAVGVGPVGVRVAIPHTNGVFADTLIGSAVITEPFEAELLAGLWYINIHSSAFPVGEIRGQVIPEPSTLALAGLGLLALAVRRRIRQS